MPREKSSVGQMSTSGEDGCESIMAIRLGVTPATIPIKRPATDGEEVSPMDGHPSSTSPVSASRRSCSKATLALRAFDLDRGRIVGFGLKMRAVVVRGTAPGLVAEMAAYEPHCLHAQVLAKLECHYTLAHYRGSYSRRLVAVSVSR